MTDIQTLEAEMAEAKQLQLAAEKEDYEKALNEKVRIDKLQNRLTTTRSNRKW